MANTKSVADKELEKLGKVSNLFTFLIVLYAEKR